MADDKIHYSDLVVKDDSIQQLIQELTELNKTYGQTLEAIKQGADKIVGSLSKASGATKQGRSEIESAAALTAKLERAYNNLDTTLGRLEKRLTQVSAQLGKSSSAGVKQAKEVTKATQAQRQAHIGYLASLNKELREAKDIYAQLISEGKSGEAGEWLSLITELDGQVKKINEDIGIATGRIKQKTAATQAATVAQKAQKPILNSAEKAERNLANATGEVAEETAKLKQETISARAETQKAALTAKYGDKSYIGLKATLNDLIQRYIALDQSTEDNITKAKELAAEIRVLRAQLGVMEEQIGSSNLGNYGSSFNRLGYSVAQVVRELPSAAISTQTFFLAISNNLPIVIDEVNRLREANKANAELGKDKVIPIGKQILKGIFNWQTLLIGLITILSMHGNEILAWCKKVLTGRDALLSYDEAMEKTRKEFKEDVAQAGKNIALYEALRIQWSLLSTEASKTAWLKKHTDLISDLGIELENVNEANKFFLDNSENIRQAYIKQALAEAAMALAATEAEEAIKSQMRLQELRKRQAEGQYTFWERFRASLSNTGTMSGPGSANANAVTPGDILASSIEKAELKAMTFDERMTALLAAFTNLSEASRKIFEPFTKGLDKTEREGRDLEERLNNLYLKAKKNYENDLTVLERNEAEKRRKQAQDDYAQRIRDIENDIRKANKMLNNEDGKYKDLTDEQKQLLVETIKTLEQSKITAYNVLVRALYDANIIAAQATRDFMSTQNELQEELAIEGSQKQLDIQLAALDLELEAMKAANREKEKMYRVDEKIFEDIITKRKKLLIGAYELEQFGLQQDISAARFGASRPSQTAATQFDIQQQIDLLEKQKQLATEGKLQWTPEDFELADAQIANLNAQLEDTKDIIGRIGELGITGTILDALGFDADAIGAFEDAVGIIIDNLKEIAQAEVDLAQAAVDAAEERVSAAQSAYEAEVEARNNGYANSVATAKAELQQEKKKQAEKERLLREAQKRQANLDTISQASSLITASANIWSSMSKVGVIGPALAVAAIAGMWASFAAAKAKARQVTSQEYGEGGLEFLQGGSHASGNDIDLGTTNSRGRRMRAEGGEAMAIINKRNTRRYRKVLPDVIDSLNRGTFENKYLNRFSNRIDTPIISAPQIDLSALERDVAEIKKQNTTKYYAMGDGTVLIVKGNVKQHIK